MLNFWWHKWMTVFLALTIINEIHSSTANMPDIFACKTLWCGKCTASKHIFDIERNAMEWKFICWSVESTRYENLGVNTKTITSKLCLTMNRSCLNCGAKIECHRFSFCSNLCSCSQSLLSLLLPHISFCLFATQTHTQWLDSSQL